MCQLMALSIVELATSGSYSAPSFLRRLFFELGLRKNEIHKVSQILVSRTFLQPFRHER